MTDDEFDDDVEGTEVTQPEGLGSTNRSNGHGNGQPLTAVPIENLTEAETYGLIRANAVTLSVVAARVDRIDDHVQQVMGDVASIKKVSQETFTEVQRMSTRVWMLEVLRESIPKASVFVAAVVGALFGSGAVATVVWFLMHK